MTTRNPTSESGTASEQSNRPATERANRTANDHPNSLFESASRRAFLAGTAGVASAVGLSNVGLVGEAAASDDDTTTSPCESRTSRRRRRWRLLRRATR